MARQVAARLGRSQRAGTGANSRWSSRIPSLAGWPGVPEFRQRRIPSRIQDGFREFANSARGGREG